MIRTAEKKDAKEILEIYAYYIENTAITFEYTIPTLDEFKERIQTTLEKYPYLVYEEDGILLGYAYAGAFNKRAAAVRMAETSIYVRKGADNRGIGKLLYRELEMYLRKQNILKLIACIADAEVEDSYVTKNSLKFHRYMGYETIGRIAKGGYKFGRWYDLVYMEKQIGEYTPCPKDVINFSELL